MIYSPPSQGHQSPPSIKAGAYDSGFFVEFFSELIFHKMK